MPNRNGIKFIVDTFYLATTIQVRTNLLCSKEVYIKFLQANIARNFHVAFTFLGM